MRARAGGKGPVAQDFEEALALHQLHHQAGGVPGLAEVDDAHHRRVLHRGEQAGFALEALGHPRLQVEIMVEHLDGHLAAQGHLLAQVHLSHAARADRSEHPETAIEDEGVGGQHRGHIGRESARRMDHLVKTGLFQPGAESLVACPSGRGIGRNFEGLAPMVPLPALPMATESDSPKPASASGAASPELRLLDRRAFVGFPPLALAPGARHRRLRAADPRRHLPLQRQRRAPRATSARSSCSASSS